MGLQGSLVLGVSQLANPVADGTGSSQVGWGRRIAEQRELAFHLLNRQAMSTDLSLILSTTNVMLDDTYTSSFGVKPGPYVCIKVQDRGKGIEPAIMKRIFEPFFTTKKRGRGTGLGLASAFGIIKNPVLSYLSM